MDLKDSGKRTTFQSGATREIDEDDKGRCDLVYGLGWFDVTNDPFYLDMETFLRTGDRFRVVSALEIFIHTAYPDLNTAYLEVAKHYVDGAKKYSDRNMEKGLPWHSMVDSALRHYAKFCRGDVDEPHDRAVIWNLLTLLYMIDNKPEFNDLPLYGKEEE